MADEGTPGDPIPPFDESFILGGPHEPSHSERLIEAERRAAAERMERLRREREAAAGRTVVPFRRPKRGGHRFRWPAGPRRRTGRRGATERDGGNRWVAIALIALAVGGIAFRGVHFSSGNSNPPPTGTVVTTTVPASSSSRP